MGSRKRVGWQGRPGDNAKEESKLRQSRRQGSFHQIPSRQLWKISCVLKSGAREMGISQDYTCQPFVKSRRWRDRLPQNLWLPMLMNKTSFISPRSDSPSTPVVKESPCGTKIIQGHVPGTLTLPLHFVGLTVTSLIGCLQTLTKAYNL